jgi:hypothetical protein
MAASALGWKGIGCNVVCILHLVAMVMVMLLLAAKFLLLAAQIAGT